MKKERCIKQGGANLYKCIDLPPEFITKRIGQWICDNCIMELANRAKGKDKCCQ